MGTVRDIINFGTLVIARIQGKPIPWKVDILVTERCNLNCYYCYVDIARRRSRNPTRPEDYKLEELCRIIDELQKAGTRYISLLGGEPLMRNDIGEIITYIRSRGIYVDLFTNGVLISKKKDVLKNLDSLVVSLEGCEEVQTLERGKYSFRRIIEDLPILKESGVPLRFNLTMTRNNLHELDFIVDLARHYDAQVTIGEATKNYYDEDIVNENMPSGKEIQDFWQKVRSLIDKGAPILKSKNSLEQLIASGGVISQDEILWPSDPRMKQLRLFPCQFGRYICQLSAEGIFYPCPKLYGRQGQSIYERGILGAFNRMAEETKCVNCRMSLVCNVNGFLSCDPKTLLKTASVYFRYRKKKSIDERIFC